MKRITIAAALAAVLAAPAVAQVPQTMSHQGVLNDNLGNLVPDGAYNLTFRIYDVAVGGVALWTEALPGVAVVDGGFSVTLGLTTPLALAFDKQYWLEVQVFATPPLAPRVRLASSPYGLSLRLPFDGKTGSAGTAMRIENTGTGPAIHSDGPLRVGSSAHGGNATLIQAGTGTTMLQMIDHGGQGGAVNGRSETGATTYFLQPDAHGTGGFLFVDGAPSGSFLVDGNPGGSGNPTVSINGTRSMTFATGAADGNSSVALPADAISAAETLDEPGVAHHNANSVALTSTMSSLMSRTITCPAAGHVVALGSADVSISHTSGTTTNVFLGLSTTAGVLPGNQDFQALIPSGAPSGTWDQTVTGHAVFTVGAGATTVHLNGLVLGNSATAFDLNLTLMYFPTAYGTVTSPPPPSARAGDEDGAPARMGQTAADIEAERAEAEAFNQQRLVRELEAVRSELDALQRQVEQSLARQLGR